MNRLLLSLAVTFLCFAPVVAGQRIVVAAGNGQTGINGYPLRDDLVVQVCDDTTGRPLEGVPVFFSVLNGPACVPQHTNQPVEQLLNAPRTMTGIGGYARARLRLPATAAEQIFVTAATPETIDTPAIFEVNSHAKYWLITLALGLCGGLGLFLFGMFFLNDAMQRIAGPKLREILIRLTSSPLRGAATGIFVTIFNQSSTATTLLEVSLVGAGLLTFYQTMAVTMGAELGSTITAQLVAFKLSEFAVFIAGAGFFIAFVAKSKKWRDIGNAVAGFGILFLGMKIMADLMMPLRSYAPFMEMMSHVENPVFGILVGMGFTMLIHSSGATSGIVIALALANVINLAQAIPLNLGAQIGTCITAALGSIGRGREGKKVALWHVMHQTAGVLLVFPFITFVRWDGVPVWITFVQWFTHTVCFSDDPARQIAMAHTVASFINMMVFLPLLPFMHRLITVMFPAKEEQRTFGPQYIDEGFLSSPPLALEQSRKEIVREGEIVIEMMRLSAKVFESRDLRLSETVSLMDIRADVLRNAVVPYLARISQNSALTEEQSKQQLQLLYIAADFESIGDIIDKNIMPLARKKLENDLWFSDQGWKDIVSLHSRVMENLDRALSALMQGDMEPARMAAESSTEINGYEADLRKRHIERLNSGLKEALETSSVHLDLLEQFKRVNSLVVSIGRALLGQI